MPYIATRDVNTEFADFKKGEIAPDLIGAKYSAFELVEEPKKEEPKKEEPKKEVKKEEPKKEVKKPAAKKAAKKEEPKEEILTEVSGTVAVEITEE